MMSFKILILMSYYNYFKKWSQKYYLKVKFYTKNVNKKLVNIKKFIKKITIYWIRYISKKK